MKLLLLVFPLACALAGEAQAQEAAITLGAALPLSGVDAKFGRFYRDGYQLAVDTINAKGGVTVAGKRYNFVLKILDDESDGETSRRRTFALATYEKADFLLGPYQSATVMTNSTVAERQMKPMVEGGGASSRIFDRHYRFVFGTLPPAEHYYASTIAMLGAIEPKAKNIGLVTADDTSFDVALAHGTRALIKNAGMSLVMDEHFYVSEANFESHLAGLKDKRPDALLWGDPRIQFLAAVRQSEQAAAGHPIFIAFAVGVVDAAIRKALGKDAENLFGMTPWVPSRALGDEWFGDAQKFAALYREKFGYDPDYHAATAAADVEVYAKAIAAAGTLDDFKVRDAIAAVDFMSIYGRIRFGANGQIDVPQIVVQVQDGAVVPIYTDKLIGKPRYPVPPWDTP